MDGDLPRPGRARRTAGAEGPPRVAGPRVARRRPAAPVRRRDAATCSTSSGRSRPCPSRGRSTPGRSTTARGSFRGTGPDGGKPRVIRVLRRGDVRDPQQVVGPGTVPILDGVPARFDLPPDAPEGERRAALARWLTDPRHPLTWRSIVNRVWQYHFGRGIVDSPNDFGRMGQAALAPRAARLAGGRVPRRRPVAQGAAPADRDERHLPAVVGGRRGRRPRIDGDNVVALADEPPAAGGRGDPRRRARRGAAGSTCAWAGRGSRTSWSSTPSTRRTTTIDLFDPEDPRAHRRSVYRFIVRSQPQPFMTTLDCADPSMSVDKRNESTDGPPGARPAQRPLHAGDGGALRRAAGTRRGRPSGAGRARLSAWRWAAHRRPSSARR